MAYDGTIMQRALARFDQAKQRRADELEQRRRLAFARQPRLAEIDRELRGTMGRIVKRAQTRCPPSGCCETRTWSCKGSVPSC